jgi:hypothetical protein
LLLSWFDDMMYSYLAVSTLPPLELSYGGLTTEWIGIEKYHTLVSFDCLRRLHDLPHHLLSRGIARLLISMVKTFCLAGIVLEVSALGCVVVRNNRGSVITIIDVVPKQCV